MGNNALVALYIPLSIYSALAAFLYFKGVLWPAYRRGELSVREHGLAICIVAGLGMDAVETVYYGAGRVYPELRPVIHGSTAPIITMRLLVMFTSIIALASYFHIVGHKWRLPHVVLGAVVIWAAAFWWISTR